MTREEYIDFANALKNNYTIDFDKLPEFCDMAISALFENKTQMIDKSNFDIEQYKADLQSAYDCGYNTALSENKEEWIPITTRPMTEEEKEAYHGEYDPNDMTMYDCKMPEDGQEVLVTTRYGDVNTDTFYHDDGWYFENFCDDGDVLAWQPLPEPYKAESEEK